MSYNGGIAILQKLFNYMKTTYTYDQFITGLKKTWDGRDIPIDDFNSWVTGLDKTRSQYAGIVWKTQSDFDNILKKIADKVPVGKLPTQKMIDSAFINPDNFTPSFIDMAVLTAKATGKLAKTTGEKALSTLSFIDQYKTYLLFGVLGFIGYKFLDKATAAGKLISKSRSNK